MGRHRADIIRFITECPSTGLRAKCLEGLKIPQEVRASQISYSRLRLPAVWKTVTCTACAFSIQMEVRLYNGLAS
jgi:hypothetical protein